MSDSLLKIEGLKTYFYTDDGVIPAVDGVDIEIFEGETVGIVGESGCGKSVTSLTAMQLTPGKVIEGSITFNGKDILSLNEKEMRKIRGKEMAMIFQEPMTSLNPLFTIGNQISEAVRIHLKYDKKKAKQRSIEMLKMVGIPRPEEVVDDYPHQLSGGMRQRAMIAMAMSCNPRLLIADEPTTALDVTIQAQILDLMKDLKESSNTAIMLITHDLGVVAEMCDRVIVMYAGKVVEHADVKTLFREPKHPYTQGLLKSVPNLNNEQKRLYSIKGNVPIPGSLKGGCPFAPRCEYAMEICREREPTLKEVKDNHLARCLIYELDKEESTNHVATTH